MKIAKTFKRRTPPRGQNNTINLYSIFFHWFQFIQYACLQVGKENINTGQLTAKKKNRFDLLFYGKAKTPDCCLLFTNDKTIVS